MSTTDQLLVQTARRLEEARRILEGVEATELKGISPDEWLTFEEAAAYLEKTPKALEKGLTRREIPEHYPTERGILFSRKELDEWLM